ncbi:NOL1/NOP2/sun family putative RNA met [Saccharata proteae CBS 121410]|uniref:Nucleolar protein 2 n=1 Tax=Saccharata proteae CBS 121410 TaxID=1314787 RepID=A0A9P4M1D7_9PEZI|nr:NOL1/NOP2/sun family putative RNA met [Saccharata proteae CBS 121410]
MGVGRRMKKQGPPAPLDESLVTRKRKNAPSAESAPAAANGRPKKRRTSDEGLTVKPNKFAKPAKTSTPAKTITTQKEAGAKVNGKAKAKAKPAPAEDEMDLEEVSDWEDEDSEAADGVDVSGLDGLDMDDDEVEVDDDEPMDSDADVVDSDEEIRKGMWSEDESDDDAEEKLTAANIEGLSRKLDMQKAREEAEAQAELEEAALQTNIAGDRPKILEDEDEEGAQMLAPDLQLLRTRITDTIRVLDDFSNLAEEGRSRAEYTAQLLKDICTYYGYSPFLAEKLFDLFTPREAFAFFEANETPRPLVIRTNTLRTHRRQLAQALINRGVTLEPVGKWSKVGLQVFESQVPIGATPEYLAGHYILQAASSFLPVMALAPQEHERVLDMASAPGGKTTHIAALMKNTGCIFANDANKARAKGLIGNIHRLGVKNTVVCNYDAMEFPRVIGGFDRVLLDAPCSGTGVIAKDASVKTNKTEKDFMRLPHLQKQLLLHAIDSVDHASKTGGYIVYSTCSVTVDENERVVQYALEKRPNVKLVSTGLTFGKEGFTNYKGRQFHPSLKETRRYYPHAYNVDGFFVAKFKKTGPTPANAVNASNASSSAKITNGAGKIEKDDEYVDKTPVPTDAEDSDDFGGFDESEDEKLIENSKKKALRRKGKDPRAVKEKVTEEVVGEDEVPKGVEGKEKAKEVKKAAEKKESAETKEGGKNEVAKKVEEVVKEPKKDAASKKSKKSKAKAAN